MSLRIDNAEIWHWYNVINECNSSGLLPKKFCEKFGHDYAMFTSRHNRIVWKSKTDPVMYAKLVPLGRKFLASGMRPSDFVKIHDIDMKTLSTLATHLNYINAIEEMKSQKELKSMQFIQVTPSNLPTTTAHVEPEVVKKQNDLELIISKGVKVTVAPEVGADKLMRIIELLKDL